MQIFPAIDLRGGQAVRLFQGDYGQETVYNSDPAAVARGCRAAGAKFLHVVDLDGARDIQVHHLAEALQYRPPGHLRT